MKINKLLILCVLGLASACSTQHTNNQVQNGNPPPPATVSTQEFVTATASGNRFEVAASRMALHHSKDAAVLKLAHRLIADHLANNKHLKKIVVADNLPKPPDGMSIHQQEILDGLKDSQNFNEDYLNTQAQAHREAIDMFRVYKHTGDNADLQKFAAQTLPILHKHYHMIEHILGHQGQ